MKKEVLKPAHEADAVAIIDRLLSGGVILPEQQPKPSHWSPEKELAAEVLIGALTEVRDFEGDPSHNRKVAEDLKWIFSDDTAWPYSFARLCAVFGLEPTWVRKVVLGWVIGSRAHSQQQSGQYRPAA